MSITTRLAGVLAVLAVAVTGCAAGQPDAQPSTTASPSATRPAKSAPSDKGLRDVAKAMLYSDGIAYVFPETAAQMLCGALSPGEWGEALGGPVGRSVYGAGWARCVVSTGERVVELQMTDELVGPGERVGGRLVRFESTADYIASAWAAIAPIGEQDRAAQVRAFASPVLVVRLTGPDPDPDLLTRLRRLLTTLLPRLTPTGPVTPIEDRHRHLDYVPTEPVAGVPIVDLPRTVQSRVLCTVLLRETGTEAQPAHMALAAVSECEITRPQHFLLNVDEFLPPVQPQLTIAGHPAQDMGKLGIVIDLLDMDSGAGRTDHIALQLNNFAPHDQLLAFATKVATALLAG